MAKPTNAEPGNQQEVVRVTIRVPAALHRALWDKRQQTGQSLNDILIEAAATLLGIPVPTLQKGIPGPKPRKPE